VPLPPAGRASGPMTPIRPPAARASGPGPGRLRDARGSRQPAAHRRQPDHARRDEAARPDAGRIQARRTRAGRVAVGTTWGPHVVRDGEHAAVRRTLGAWTDVR